MTAVKGVVGAAVRPRTVGSARRRDGKHQLSSIEQDEERGRALKTKLPLSLSLKQAWSTTSQDVSPTVDQTFDEFQKAWEQMVYLCVTVTIDSFAPYLRKYVLFAAQIEDCIHRHNLEKIHRRFEVLNFLLDVQRLL